MSNLMLVRAPHKYIQGKGALKSFYSDTKDLGDRLLFICSRSAYKNCHDLIEKSFENTDSYRQYEVFGGISSTGEIEKMRKMVRENNISVVVGLGGGSAIDTAKATAFYENIKVIIIPTVAATDAPCTGLSVIYNDNGTFNSYIFYPQNPDVVVVDTEIIAKAPVKFLVAGMGDALGTYFEARACKKSESLSLEGGGISKSAIALCKLCYESLIEHGEQAKIACEQKVVTPALEAIVEATIYLSGVGADNGGLAVAHSVYNGFTALEECERTMHGDIVAFGTIIQLILEEAPKCELEEVMDFCYSVGLPMTLEEIGVKDVNRVHIAAEKACAEGESIHNLTKDVTPEELYSAILVADTLGQAYNRL